MYGYEINPAVLKAVNAAREKQIAAHGDTSHDAHHDNGTWALILGEEFGEWCLSLLQGKPDAFENAAHVAACAIAFMEARREQP